MKLPAAITDNMYLYGFGRIVFWVAVWVVSGRVRAAKSVAANQVNQVSDSGGTNA